ncbi:MAG: hypothetical protein GY851_13550, partial [bacterium]|nr:hypothetical protein [bacterium]
AVSIIANKFDYCRHHIASGGAPGCAYEAAWNLILPHATGHYFDMHGGRDRDDGTDIAGTTIDIHNNTFRAPQTPVVIRGVPEDRCDVHHNWFEKHTEPAAAVRASDKTNVFDNAYGPAPQAAK